MPRKGNGVEIRDTSIRIAFTDHTGAARRETLKTGNVPLLPTPANVKHANRVRGADNGWAKNLLEQAFNGSAESAEERTVM